MRAVCSEHGVLVRAGHPCPLCSPDLAAACQARADARRIRARLSRHREALAIGATVAIVAVVLALLALAFAGERLDPNEACRGHDGVQRVYQTGRSVDGVVCRDGHWERSR